MCRFYYITVSIRSQQFKDKEAMEKLLSIPKMGGGAFLNRMLLRLYISRAERIGMSKDKHRGRAQRAGARE